MEDEPQESEAFMNNTKRVFVIFNAALICLTTGLFRWAIYLLHKWTVGADAPYSPIWSFVAIAFFCYDGRASLNLLKLVLQFWFLADDPTNSQLKWSLLGKPVLYVAAFWIVYLMPSNLLWASIWTLIYLVLHMIPWIIFTYLPWTQRGMQITMNWAMEESIPYIGPYTLASIALFAGGSRWAFHLWILFCVGIAHAMQSLTRMQGLAGRMVLWAPLAIMKTLISGPIKFIFWVLGRALRRPYSRVRFQFHRAQNALLHWQKFHSDLGEYEYTSLQPGEIRLLEIRRKWNLQLECRIFHCLLADPPPYDAISYRWDSSDFSSGVVVDEKWLEMTSTVYSVLSDRASFFAPRLLWIDSISINQRDLEEKSAQVVIMDTIYASAQRTIVWLGPSPYAYETFHLLEELLERVKTINELAPAVSQVWKGYTQSYAKKHAIFLKYDTRYRDLAKFLCNDYFFRIWMMQEIAMGAQVHVRSGGCWMDWDRFAGCIRLFADPTFANVVGIQELYRHWQEPCGVGQIGSFAYIRDRVRLGQRMPEDFGKPMLREVLVESFMSAATDPRDMVYAVLSLTQESALPYFKPDYYAKSVRDLYIEVAVYFIARKELHTILNMAGIGHARKIADLPSWVVDWTSTAVPPSLRRNPPCQYNASAGTALDLNLVSRRILSIRGLHVDKISAMADMSYGGLINTGRPKKVRIMLDEMCVQRQAVSLARALLPATYINGQPLEEALWRTHVGDATRRALTSEEASMFELAGASNIFSPLRFTRPASADIGVQWENSCKMMGYYEKVGLRSGDDAADDYDQELVRKDFKQRVEALSEEEQADMSHHIALVNHYTRDGISLLSENFVNCGSGRRFVITEKGYMAMTPDLTELGDEIVIFYGMEIPYVVRRVQNAGDDDKFQVVGECYVHGVMDGQLISEDSEDERVFLLG